ncbi:MAG: thioredoxin family protein [Phycisphaerales bacterium]
MLKLKNRGWLGAVAGGVALLGIAGSPVLAQDAAAPAEKKQEKSQDKKPTAKIGEAAPGFELKDTDGKTVKLSDYKGKVVVLEWFNPECPIVVGHYKMQTMQKTQDQFKGKGVVWLAINSGAPGQQGAGLEKNADARTKWKMAQPVLIDESGTVGRAYGAKTSPHMYVIDAKGTLVYNGAIDDGNGRSEAKTNYAANAIEAALKGETVSPAETRPYGCPVKYGKSGA